MSISEKREIDRLYAIELRILHNGRIIGWVHDINEEGAKIIYNRKRTVNTKINFTIQFPYWLNINPDGKEKGLLTVFNPLPKRIQKTLQIPLYYTGLTHTAQLRHEDGPAKKMRLNRDFSIKLLVTVEAESITWFVVE